MQALLSLGASSDYKDRRGLTPLYHTVLTGGETSCCETLLYHHAKLGIRDENGWDETHQVHVCRLSLRVQVGLSEGPVIIVPQETLYLLGFVLEALEKERSRGFLCVPADNILMRLIVCSCARVCACVRTHSCHDLPHLSCLVLDTFHLSSHPSHPLWLLIPAVKWRERNSRYRSGLRLIHISFSSISCELHLLLPVHVLLKDSTCVKIWTVYYHRCSFCNKFLVLVFVLQSSAENLLRFYILVDKSMEDSHSYVRSVGRE